MIRYLINKSSAFVRVQAFPMYDGIGVSVPALHRESNDSLIDSHNQTIFYTVGCSHLAVYE